MENSVKPNLQDEVKELFQDILDKCDNHSFAAIKAALLLARDHVVSKEILSKKLVDGE